MERCYLIAFTLPAHVLVQAPVHPLLPDLTSNDLSIPSVRNMFIPIPYLFDKEQENKEQFVLPFHPFFPYHLIFLIPLFPCIFFHKFHSHTLICSSFCSLFTLANWTVIFKEQFFSFLFFFFSSIINSIYASHYFFYIPLSCILHFHPARIPLSTITHVPFIILLYL